MKLTKMNNGFVSKIQRFSLHDGDGVRTTVFLKGCNLHCFWCHNPETITMKPAIQCFFDLRCIGCKACAEVCPAGAMIFNDQGHYIDRDKCMCCGRCAEVCFSEAIVVTGKSYTICQIMEEVQKDRRLYEISKGGITLSGGEPLLQPDFVLAILNEAKKEGINCAIDTAGNVPFTVFEMINNYVDTYLYDVKSVDKAIHKQITGSDNTLILENLIRLDEICKDIVIRMPLMQDINDSEGIIQETIALLKRLKHLREVNILPIHKLASAKYRSLDLDYSLVESSLPMSKERIHRILQQFKDAGIPAREN